MQNALLTVCVTALGVGGATAIGALLGFLIKKPSHKMNDLILSFAAGVMLAAAVIGLILPAVDYGGKWGLPITIVGIFVGAFCLNLIDKLTPHLHRLAGPEQEDHPERAKNLNKVLLFVIAIGIHNLPEGLAAGVSFGTDNVAQAMAVAIGIALQNIPEGMIIIAPLLSAGMSRGRTLAIALLTGAIEVVGTLIGYFAVSISKAVLPFFLAFAGGIMLYIISDEMLSETHHDNERGATYALLIGFCLMLAVDVLLG